MDGRILLDSESCEGRDNNFRRGKLVKGDSVGISPMKMLADITNMQRQGVKPLKQHAKEQSASLAAEGITDQLLKENAMLMKLLANRNTVIQSREAEIQKWQSNFQKLRKQNLQLAQANTQLLAELNSDRQRLRELQHELGCKNGILKARKLESMEKEHKAKLAYEISANEVGTSQSDQSGQTQEDYMKNNLGNAKKRRISKVRSSAPAVIKQVNSTVNQRYSLRRQSRVFKGEKPEPTKDPLEVDDVRYCISHLQENLANESEPASSEALVQEDIREGTKSSGPTVIGQVHAKEKIENKSRHSLRRISARFKPENPEPTEDLFDIDDKKFPVIHSCDNLVEKSCPTTSSLTFGHFNEERNNARELDPQEIRRSSVGRPLRHAAVKVQSYKEIPLNKKMRRPE